MEVDISRPLVRGLVVVNEGVKKWIWVKHEGLPRFCSSCGIMRHTTPWCTSKQKVEAQPNKGSSHVQGVATGRAVVGEAKGGKRTVA